MECEAQCRARTPVAVMLRARVPSGSLSQISGKRFAAPGVCYYLAFMLCFWSAVRRREESLQ